MRHSTLSGELESAAWLETRGESGSMDTHVLAGLSGAVTWLPEPKMLPKSEWRLVEELSVEVAWDPPTVEDLRSAPLST
jgi:hypothetical protein